MERGAERNEGEREMDQAHPKKVDCDTAGFGCSSG
jgi:hypothetical protein